MLTRTRRRALFLSLALLGALGGASAGADLQTQLDAVAGASTVELTTIGRKSGLPRTVTIWFVRDGERIYVQSGKDGKTHWYRNLLANPDVSLRIDDLRLRGRARAIEDPLQVEAVLDRFRAKYWMARLSGWVGGDIGNGRPVAIEELKPLGESR